MTAAETLLRQLKGQVVKSSVNGKAYRLFVSLPYRYSSTDTTHYPVLYQLDGFYAYPMINNINSGMEFYGQTQPIIIVSIADSSYSGSYWYRSRWTDYTMATNPKGDSLAVAQMRFPPGTLKSGGAEAFLKTLKTDIMPFVDTHYRTTTDRGINGHSFGGTFTTYCLLTEPTLFNRYSINSPALSFDSQTLLRLEQSFLARVKSLNARVFLSVGDLEGKQGVDDMQSFATFLKNLRIPGLVVKSHVFEDETHESVLGPSISRTLQVLYGVKTK